MSARPTVDALRARLRAARRRITAGAAARGALVTVAVVGAALALALGAEAALWLGVGVRLAVVGGLAVLAAGLLGVFVGVPLLRGAGLLPGLSEREVARRAGAGHAAGSRLSALLDLADGQATGADRLREAALEALARDVQAVPLERVPAWAPARRVLPWAGAAVLGLAALFVAAPASVGGAAVRLMAPSVPFLPPAPFALRVEPGDVDLVRGADLAVRAVAEGRAEPATAVLELERPGERRPERVDLRRAADGAFAHTVEGVRQSVRYRVVAEGVASPWYTAAVGQRPVVRGVQVAVRPPGYTGRRAVVLPAGVGDASGLPGSAVSVAVGVGGPPVAAAWLDVRWASGARGRVPLRISGEGDRRVARGAFGLRGPGRYSVRLRTASGLENTDPAVYTLGTFADAPPQIALVEHGDGEAAVPVAFRITDDAGFSGGAVVWRVAAREGRPAGAFRRAALPVRTRPLDQLVETTFRPLGARPGDTVEFYGEVRELGPGRTARTPLASLRITSTADRLDDLDARRDSTGAAMERLDARAAEQARQVTRLREEIRRRPEADWEGQRQVGELRRGQEALREEARQMQDRLRQLAEQMDRAGAATPELQRQVEQMERVMQELQSPELQEALRRLQEAMEQLDLQQMIEQADAAQEQEQDFRERLERARALMERLEAAVQMEAAARRAEDLAEREEELARDARSLREQGRPRTDAEREAAGDAPPPEGSPRTPEAERARMADEQRRAAEDAAEMERRLDALRERMEQAPGLSPKELDRTRQEMQGAPPSPPSPSESSPSPPSPSPPGPSLEQQMRQNAEQIQRNQMQPAEAGQREMARRLRRAAQRMRQQSAAAQGQQQRIDTAALRRALEDVLTLSREQERLAGQTAGVPSGTAGVVPLARRQRELRDGLRTVADTLRRVSRTVPQLDARVRGTAAEAAREMDTALGRFAERDAPPAAAAGRTAMGHLNDLALLLANVLDQQQQNPSGSGGGAGSPGQQLQQSGEAQRQLGEQIQQMLNEQAGERLQPGQSGQPGGDQAGEQPGDQGRRIRELAERQEQIRRQIQEILRQNGDALGPAARSQLQRLQEQMGEAAAQLRRGRLDAAAAPRQQLIQQRMLEAERSATERGQEERREGEAARGTPPAPPARLSPPERPADRVRRDLIRALESGYAPDYRDLIQRYFERLQGRAE